MADGSGGLQSDQLFLGLTRPAMVMGVHYMIFMLNFVLATLLFININDYKFPIVMISAVSVHATAYLVCLKEPRAIELFMVRYGKFSRCKNRLYYKHTNSYDVT